MTKGMKWYNNGIRNLLLKPGEAIPQDFMPGKLTFNIWITDDVSSVQICKNAPVPEGWHRGRTVNKRHN